MTGEPEDSVYEKRNTFDKGLRKAYCNAEDDSVEEVSALSACISYLVR